MSELTEGIVHTLRAMIVDSLTGAGSEIPETLRNASVDVLISHCILKGSEGYQVGCQGFTVGVVNHGDFVVTVQRRELPDLGATNA